MTPPTDSTTRSYLPLPTVIVDNLLPTLKDTEFRVLLVVLRQTWGWTMAKGQPKPMDWLAHSQLKAKTGRASEAISAAIDTLVQRGLINVIDERGMALTSSSLRRRCRGKMLFSPGPVLAPYRFPANRKKSAMVKTKTTT